MKQSLRLLFKPLLDYFESGTGDFAYKPSHRVILLVMSGMFIGLATAALLLMPETDYGYLFPVVIFGGTGCLGLIIGCLGKHRAVAKIWGSR